MPWHLPPSGAHGATLGAPLTANPLPAGPPSLAAHNQPRRATSAIPTSRTRKLRLRRATWLLQGHTASESSWAALSPLPSCRGAGEGSGSRLFRSPFHPDARGPGATCSGELVGHLPPNGPGKVEVVVVLVDALEEQRDVLEDDGVLAPALLREAQLLIQPRVLGLLQGRAPGGVVQELGVEDQEQDAPDPEAEIVISPRLLKLCDGLGGGDVAHVVVAADEDQRDLAVHVPEHPLQVCRLLLPPGHPCKSEGHVLTWPRLLMHLPTPNKREEPRNPFIPARGNCKTPMC